MDAKSLNRAILASPEFVSGKWLHCLRKFLPELKRFRDQFRSRTLDAETSALRDTYRKLYLEQTMPTGEAEIDVDVDSYIGNVVEESEQPEYSRKSRLVFTRKLWSRTNNVTEQYDPIFLLDWDSLRIISNTWKKNARYIQLKHRVTPLEKHVPYADFPDKGYVERFEFTPGVKVKHIVPARSKAILMYQLAQQGNDAGWMAEMEHDLEAEETAQAISLYGISQSELPVYLQPEVEQTDWSEVEYLEQIGAKARLHQAWKSGKSIRLEATPESCFALAKRVALEALQEAALTIKLAKAEITEEQTSVEFASKRGDFERVRELVADIRRLRKEIQNAIPDLAYWENLEAINRCIISVTAERVIGMDDWYDLYAEELAEQGTVDRKIRAEISEESRHLLERYEEALFADLPETHNIPNRTQLFNRTLFYLLMDERKDVRAALAEATKAYCQKYPYIGMRIEAGVAKFRNRFGELRHSATVRREIISGKIEITPHQRATLRAIQAKLTQYEQREWKQVLS